MVSAVKGRKLSLMEVKYTVEEAEEEVGSEVAEAMAMGIIIIFILLVLL